MKKNEIFSVNKNVDSNFHRMTREEEIETGRLALSGDTQAQKKLVTANIGFAIHMANFTEEHMNTGLELEDLIQEAYCGMVVASKTFDPDKGAKFTTYASWWVRDSIQKAMRECGRSVRMPAGRNDILYDKKWRKTSLDSLLDNSGKDGATLESMVSDPKISSPEDEAVRKSQRDALRKEVKKLSKTEQAVITSRFGLDGSEPQKLAEIGRTLGLSRERIRQIESGAISKLKHQISLSE